MDDNTSQIFFNSINDYHERVQSILTLMTDYFTKNNKTYEKNFLAIRLKEHVVLESNIPIEDLLRSKTEEWSKKEDKIIIYDTIYRVDLPETIFLFKIFPFQESEYVLAGYNLKENFSVYSFLASLSEKKIVEKYEKILNLI